MGLVLTVRQNEVIQIGTHITVQVSRIRSKQVGIRIDAPKDMQITRPERKAQIKTDGTE